MLTRAHASLSDLDKLKSEVKQEHEPQTDQVEGTETYWRMGRWMHVAQIIMLIFCIMSAIDNETINFPGQLTLYSSTTAFCGQGNDIRI